MQRHASARGGQAQQQQRSAAAGAPARVQHHGSGRAATACASSTRDEPAALKQDPEAKFRRYGKDFGARYSLNEPMAWLSEAPRVRIRSMEDRKLEELLELAVLNERLAGAPSWEVRRRLEYLKLRRRNWEAIYHYVTQTDACATLALIEEANRKVEEALSEESQQRTGVAALQAQLVTLQEEVSKAAEKLSITQQRVEKNLQRVNELKAEAAALERMRLTAVADAAASGADTLRRPAAAAQASARQASTVVVEQPATVAAPPTRRAPPRVQAPARSRQALQQRKVDRGLHSSLEMEEQLKQFWHPVAFTNMLGKDTMVPFELFNEPWVLFRDAEGKPSCIRDSCAHRACPLSLGKVEQGRVSCAYHGWKFDGQGRCTEMPSTAFCRNVAVAALPCAEKDGFVWVFPGAGTPPAEVPSFTAPPKGFDVHAEIMVEVPVEHGLLIENLLDLAHAPFTHQGTFARGWSVPDAVRFHASQLLSGRWDPYPIDMAFQPPCATISMIGLQQPGKVARGSTAGQCRNHLHQLHVCMPARRGHTRLLYRMSMDFMGWARFIPGIQQIWKKVAGQVLGEDLVLVTGQQDRMQRGDDTWLNPMSYDKLAVRYRRWRNTVAAGDAEEGARLAAQARMNAGQMFSEMEEEDWGREEVEGDAKVLDVDVAQQPYRSSSP